MHMISHNKNSKKTDGIRMHREEQRSFRVATIPLTLAAKFVIILAVALFFSAGSGSDNNDQQTLGKGYGDIEVSDPICLDGSDGHTDITSERIDHITRTFTLPAEVSNGMKTCTATYIQRMVLSEDPMEIVVSIGLDPVFADVSMFCTSGNLKQ
jgi:hypothetical protein